MKGLELCERFYLEHGVPMLDSFPDLKEKLAVGIVGAGSECFGYDDEISTDHDFEPGFCIFIPDEDLLDSRSAFALERAYAKLPREFMGFKRSKLSPVGGNRHGVIKMSDFFKDKTGSADASLSLMDWLFVPEQSLAEATNGKLFFDNLGIFTRARESLEYMPEDIRLKKLAGNLLIMGQAGQYNYARCIARGETASAQLAIMELVKSTLHVIFLLNKCYIPYYKWSFHALRELSLLGGLYQPLEYLISSGNSDTEVAKKTNLIEYICAQVINELRAQGVTSANCNEAEAHAYSVNEHIKSSEIRNLHILITV